MSPSRGNFGKHKSMKVTSFIKWRENITTDHHIRFCHIVILNESKINAVTERQVRNNYLKIPQILEIQSLTLARR